MNVKKEKKQTRFLRLSWIRIWMMALALVMLLFSFASVMFLKLLDDDLFRGVASLGFRDQLTGVSHISQYGAFCLFILEALAWIIELKRYRGNIKRLVRAVVVKWRLERSLFRPSDHAGESSKKLSSYNYAVKRLSVFVSESQVTLCIPLPWDGLAQKMIEASQSVIKQKTSDLFNTFVFSSFEEKAGFLWLRGSRRN